MTKTALAPVPKPLFDRRPCELAGFTLRARSVDVVGTPTIRQWQAAFEFASATEEAAPYWIGDLLLYSRGRSDWHEKLDQAMAVTGLARHTLDNHQTVAKHLSEHERTLAQSHSHASEVASLERPEQTKWLEKSRSHGWTVRELRQAIQASKRSLVIEGQAATCHTVEVTVQVDVEAPNTTQAEDLAWSLIKQAIPIVPHAKVIAAKARPR